MEQRVWCVIPVKRLAAAKQRLAAMLAPGQREELARRMMTDVIRAARQVGALAGIAVVTADDAVAALALREGATVVRETDENGLNAALRHATGAVVRFGARAVVVIPGDVPLVAPEDIAAMIDGHGDGPAVTIARAASDGGSNALALTPPGVIDFAFGAASFERHCRLARAAGVEPVLPLLPRLALDIDRPADLAAMLAQKSATLAATCPGSTPSRPNWLN